MTLPVESEVNAVAFSSDGTRIASGSQDGLVRVWDASTGKLQNVLHGHTQPIVSVAFSRDGTRIISGSDDSLVRVWNVSTGEAQHVLEGHTDQVTSVAFSSDGTRIVSGSRDVVVRVWDALLDLLAQGKVRPMMYTERKFRGLEEMPAALKLLASGEAWGKIVVEIPQGKEAKL